jgi:hypothetical protein
VSKKHADGSPAQRARRNPTIKQSKFAIAYADPHVANGNGVAAARAAGYRGDARQLAVQASSNLKNPTVQHLMAAIVDALVEPALHRVAEAMDAVKIRSFLTKSGVIVYSQPEPDQKVRMEASKLVLELSRTRGTPPLAAGGHQDHGQDRPCEDQNSAQTSAAVSEMDPADRIAFREAGEIEEELAEIERELAEDDDDRRQQ